MEKKKKSNKDAKGKDIEKLEIKYATSVTRSRDFARKWRFLEVARALKNVTF